MVDRSMSRPSLGLPDEHAELHKPDHRRKGSGPNGDPGGDSFSVHPSMITLPQEFRVPTKRTQPRMERIVIVNMDNAILASTSIHSLEQIRRCVRPGERVYLAWWSRNWNTQPRTRLLFGPVTSKPPRISQGYLTQRAV